MPSLILTSSNPESFTNAQVQLPARTQNVSQTRHIYIHSTFDFLRVRRTTQVLNLTSCNPIAITVTNSMLYTHWKVSLIGHSDSNGAEDTPITVTLASNYWFNLSSRTPSFRFGHGHIFNNVFDDNDDGINTRDGAQLLVENNVWTGTDKPLYSIDAGFAVATGNDFGGAANTGKFSLFSRSFFQLTLLAASAVRAAVVSTAGQTLAF
ncbi:pectin lyase fold/virulence factor [Mycena olivaceomarginata]|nr:pectin lyase fold/virulence factor [Mycena olivaceomarginata]